MKTSTIRPIAAIALLAMLGAGAPALAGADTTTTTTTTTTVAPTTVTTVAPTFKQQIVAWHKAVTKYEKSRLAIMRTYNTAVRTDTRALAAALKSAHGKGAQQAALSAFHAAIKSAKSAKVAALLALGSKPERPTR
jgi:hypothetical protein